MPSVSGFLGSLWQLIQQFRPWFVVNPWEMALRIRFGKNVLRCGPGIHVKFPFVDTLCIQNVRMHMTDLPDQTMATKDGRVCSIRGIVGWRISDILKLYESVQYPDRGVAALAASAIAETVSTHDASLLTPAIVEEAVEARLGANDWGVEFALVKITDMAYVRTYRLIQGNEQKFVPINVTPEVREF